jgi:hypothetical protein
MNSLGRFQPTILSSSRLSEVVEKDGSYEAGSFASALEKSGGSIEQPFRSISSRRQEPESPKIGNWLGSLFSGKLRLVPERKLRVVERLSLGERKFVAILQVEGRKFLIGGSSSSLSMLAALDGAADRADVLKPPTDQTERAQ